MLAELRPVGRSVVYDPTVAQRLPRGIDVGGDPDTIVLVEVDAARPRIGDTGGEGLPADLERLCLVELLLVGAPVDAIGLRTVEVRDCVGSAALVEEYDIPLLEDRAQERGREEKKGVRLDKGVARSARQHKERLLGVRLPRGQPQEAQFDIRAVRPVRVLGHDHVAAFRLEGRSVLGHGEEADVERLDGRPSGRRLGERKGQNAEREGPGNALRGPRGIVDVEDMGHRWPPSMPVAGR